MSRAPAPSAGLMQAARVLPYLAVAAVVGCAAFVPISDGDIYWHLHAGRDIWQLARIPRVDTLTVSAAGRAWTDVHWLFQVGAYAAYAAGGLVGLAAVKASLLALGALSLTWAAARSAGTPGRGLAAVMVSGAFLLVRHLVPMRPVVVTMLCLAVFFLVLERMRTQPARRRWPYLVVPALQVLWSNCQGLAPLGPALVAAYLIGACVSSLGPRGIAERATVKPLVLLLGLCLLASVVTPFGWAAIALPGRLLARITPADGNVFSRAVQENIPPFVLARTAPELVWHFKWVLVGTAAAFAMARPRLPLAHLLSGAGLLGLALMANRNLPLLYWLGAPIVAIAVAPALGGLAQRWRWSKPVGRGALVAALAGQAVLAVVVQRREVPAKRPTPFHFPVESARRLAAARFTGDVFAADQHGGYLGFIVPGVRPYLDTRLVLHTGAEYTDYLAVLDQPERFDALDAQMAFRAVVLTTAYPDRALGLIWHLARSAAWRMVYTDGFEVLFLREGRGLDLGEAATVDGIVSELRDRHGANSEIERAARLHLARLLVVLGRSREALRVLATLDSRSAAQLRARAYFVAGELDAAMALARILVTQDAADVRSLVLLAEIAFSRADTRAASHWLGQAVALAPYDAEARSLTERMSSAGQGM